MADLGPEYVADESYELLTALKRRLWRLLKAVSFHYLRTAQTLSPGVSVRQRMACTAGRAGRTKTDAASESKTSLLCRTARKKRPSGLNFREAGNHKKYQWKALLQQR